MTPQLMVARRLASGAAPTISWRQSFHFGVQQGKACIKAFSIQHGVCLWVKACTVIFCHTA